MFAVILPSPKTPGTILQKLSCAERKMFFFAWLKGREILHKPACLSYLPKIQPNWRTVQLNGSL
jgi:hypothetical protein